MTLLCINNGWISDPKSSENGNWLSVQRASDEGEHLLVIASDQPLLDPNNLPIRRNFELRDSGGYYIVDHYWEGNILILKRLSNKAQSTSSQLWRYNPAKEQLLKK